MMQRRLDLYDPVDLTRKLVDEFVDVKAIKRYYDQVSGLIPAPKKSVPTVKQAYSLYTPKKQDVDLVEILGACLDEHKMPFKWKYQKRGTCVGQAGSMCADMVMAVAWLVLDKVFPGRCAVATCYTGSRVEVAGRPGSWDGSNGSWMSEFLTEWGIATLQELGLDNSELDEDERLAVRWTATRAGIPDKFELISKERPIVKSPQVTDVDEAIACLESGNPIIECSNLYGQDRNTEDTVSIYSQRGGHAQTIGGIRWPRSGDPEFKLVNSWSDSWGYNGWVWISAASLQKMLNQDDSYAFVGVQGLEPGKFKL